MLIEKAIHWAVLWDFLGHFKCGPVQKSNWYFKELIEFLGDSELWGDTELVIQTEFKRLKNYPAIISI